MWKKIIMRKIITCLIVLAFPFKIQSQDFIKTYEGLLNGKQSYLKLFSNSGQVSGNYFNISDCENEVVTGVITNNLFVFTLGTKKYTGTILPSGKIQGLGINKTINGFYFLQSSFNFQDEFNKCIVNKVNKENVSLVISDVKVLKYPKLRKSGEAWDSLFGNYKPDLFMKILDINQNALFYQENKLNDHNGESFSLMGTTGLYKGIVKIPKENYKDGLYFCLYDFDNNSEDDLISTIGIAWFKKDYDLSLIKQVFEKNGFKIQIEYYYE
ncbi:hypothetical protein TFHFJT_200049 [Tenacibaculum finnmarkense]|nr:hypothetical protein TFHFJT_200049 [Tenacibaculum finnmarkense]